MTHSNIDVILLPFQAPTNATQHYLGDQLFNKLLSQSRPNRTQNKTRWI